jgi:hypothetical protein
MKLSSAVSVGVTTFIGGATGYLTTAFASGIPAGFAWKAMAISAALAGLAALAHLYQDPVKGPATLGEQIDDNEFSRLSPEQKKAALDGLKKKIPSIGKPIELTGEYPVAIITKEEPK